MTARLAAIVIAAAMIACATQDPGLVLSRESANNNPLECVREAPTREFIEQVWHSLYDTWQLPETATRGHTVVVRLSFNAAGEMQPLQIREDDPVLHASVETTLRAARLPEPAAPVRSCLAGHWLTMRFSTDPVSH